MSEELINILFDLDIGDIKFITYIENRIKTFSLTYDEGDFLWGLLSDIR